MSRRLQDIVPDQDIAPMQAPEVHPSIDSEAKLQTIRYAAQFSLPTGDIQQLLSEIDRGRES